MMKKNVEKQNLAMIITSMSIILFTFVAIGYSKIIMIFPANLIINLIYLNLGATTIVIWLILFLNKAFLEIRIIKIIFYESIISLLLGFISLTTAILLVDLIKMNKVFYYFFSDNSTLCILLLSLGIQVGFTYFVFMYLIRIPYFSILWITEDKKLLQKHEFATKELIKKIHSTTKIEKYYSILVIIATVIWLNNDNLDPENAFENLFDSSVWILICSLSVYSSYIVMFLLKNNTLILKELK